jgi:DNA-binding MarR family transcriptional regulator
MPILPERQLRISDQPSGIMDETNLGSCKVSSFGTLSPMKERNLALTKRITDVYTYTMRPEGLEKQSAAALFDLPCACQNLRRVTRVVTRIYDQELRKAGFEITQFGLLTALAATGEANQKRLSAGFAMDSTTLTRTLGLLLKQGWVRVRRGKDRRERLFRLTKRGKRQLAEAQRYWERAEERLRRELGDEGWKNMRQTVSRITEAALAA